MEIIETKKASLLISKFSPRELSTLKYCIELLKSDVINIYDCNKEALFHDDKTRFDNAVSEATKRIFRIQYILQCLDIYAVYDWDTRILNIKTINDK